MIHVRFSTGTARTVDTPSPAVNQVISKSEYPKMALDNALNAVTSLFRGLHSKILWYNRKMLTKITNEQKFIGSQHFNRYIPCIRFFYKYFTICFGAMLLCHSVW